MNRLQLPIKTKRHVAQKYQAFCIYRHYKRLKICNVFLKITVLKRFDNFLILVFKKFTSNNSICNFNLEPQTSIFFPWNQYTLASSVQSGFRFTLDLLSLQE